MLGERRKILLIKLNQSAAASFHSLIESCNLSGRLLLGCAVKEFMQSRIK
jgi:hypothetical protein